MIRYHAKATSAVRFPSKGEAHCNSRRVLSLHRGVNFGLQRYTKSAIYFATQMQGKLCEASQFVSAFPFFLGLASYHQQQGRSAAASRGQCKGPADLTHHTQGAQPVTQVRLCGMACHIQIRQMRVWVFQF